MELIIEITNDLILPINVDSEIFQPILEDGCDGNYKYRKLKKIMRFRE